MRALGRWRDAVGDELDPMIADRIDDEQDAIERQKVVQPRIMVWLCYCLLSYHQMITSAMEFVGRPAILTELARLHPSRLAGSRERTSWSWREAPDKSPRSMRL